MPEVTVTTTDLQAALSIENAEGIEQGHLDSNVVWYEFLTQNDDRVRPSHRALHGTVWRVGDVSAPVPPLDYGCRCFIRYVAKPGSEAEKILPPAPSQPTTQAKAWGKWLDDKVPTWDDLVKAAMAVPVEDRLPTLALSIQKATGKGLPESRDLARMALATEQQGAKSPASLKVPKPVAPAAPPPAVPLPVVAPPVPAETIPAPTPAPVPPAAPVPPVAPSEAEKRAAADKAFSDRAAAYARMMAEDRAKKAEAKATYDRLLAEVRRAEAETRAISPMDKDKEERRLAKEAAAAKKARAEAVIKQAEQIAAAKAAKPSDPAGNLSQERWAAIMALPKFEPKDGLKAKPWVSSPAGPGMDEAYKRTVRARGIDGEGNAERTKAANAYLEALKRDDVVPSFSYRAAKLKGLFEKGLLNQHHTGTSGGMLNPEKRDNLERSMFGVESSAADDHPTYGYVRIGNRGSSVSQYGDIAVRLKKKVLERTTITHGDSLDKNFGLATKDGRNKAPSVPASPALEPGLQTFGTGGLDSVSYTEAQFFGKITKADIERIDFINAKPTPEQIQMLNEAGIPFTVNTGGYSRDLF